MAEVLCVRDALVRCSFPVHGNQMKNFGLLLHPKLLRYFSSPQFAVTGLALGVSASKITYDRYSLFSAPRVVLYTYTVLEKGLSFKRQVAQISTDGNLDGIHLTVKHKRTVAAISSRICGNGSQVTSCSFGLESNRHRFGSSRSIYTLRASESPSELLDFSHPNGQQPTEASVSVSDDEEQALRSLAVGLSDTSKRLVPPILKRGMHLPEKWNVPGGTVVLIDKPTGWTSFRVCERIRKLVKVKKVGHAGTLDPLATGLLVVCVGPATKLADSFQALTKVYTGTLRLGEATPSCDSDSPVNERMPWEHITDDQIQNSKQAFIGEIMQIPPMFSAIKVDGERLYEKARRGEHLDVKARKITVYEFKLEWNKKDRQELDFYVRCSKGTYIRSLCADMGRALNSCAHVTKLRREKIGDLSVDDAWEFQDLADTYRTLYQEPSQQM